jgi:hypothetical protein
MNGYQATGAGSPVTFLDTTDVEMDLPLDQSAYYGEQHAQFMQSMSFGHSPVGAVNTNEAQWRCELTFQAEHPVQPTGIWPANTTPYLRPLYQQHCSVSTNSSTSSGPRLSDNSIFSQFENRASTISNDSSVSNNSNISWSQYHSQGEQPWTDYSSPLPPYTPSPIEGPILQTSRNRTAPRIPAPEKDFYKTCVSRKQRARRSTTVSKYFCTTCAEPFGEKADWKRHEETYQERPEEFQCDLCPAKYFLDKDFVKHHLSHNCAHCSSSTKCADKKHVQDARTWRSMRTGWGCGFCYHFSTRWAERCHHVAQHFDVEGKTMKEWNHSAVIYSLLQRPAMRKEWDALIASKKRVYVGFGWNPKSTGRVEGYPDSTATIQIQDELEYLAPGQDVAALARKVYVLAVKKVEREPPPVPEKDYHVRRTASPRDSTRDTDSMTQVVQEVVDDELLPIGTTALDYDLLGDSFGRGF